MVKVSAGRSASAAASSAAIDSAVVITTVGAGSAGSAPAGTDSAPVAVVAAVFTSSGEGSTDVVAGVLVSVEEMVWPEAGAEIRRTGGFDSACSDELACSATEGASPSGLRSTGVVAPLFSSTRKNLFLLLLNTMTLPAPHIG